MSRTHASFARWLVAVATLLTLLALPRAGRAEPYLAVQAGLKCVACHVNPTGGGLRNALGVAFAQHSLPANKLPDALSGWTGSFFDERLRVGGDYRGSSTRSSVPGQATQRDTGTDQSRVYVDLQLIKNHVGVHLDEKIAPGRSERLEAYARLTTADQAWYLKAGQFYQPFGWRLQDSTAFVRSVSGISMTVPDKGIELGMERDSWSAQLAWVRTPAGAADGHQAVAQLVWLQSWGRLGGALASTRADGNRREAWGLFGGTRTGPVSWLAELDLVRDDGYPEGRRTLLAGLLEANWLIRQGHNLKATAELFDPDRRIAHDHKVRHSLVYEYTPIAFVQLRAGYRRYGGIPQNNFDNRRQGFVELHGLF